MNTYSSLVRPLLFRCDPEGAHDMMLGVAHHVGGSRLGRRLLRGMYAIDEPRLQMRIGELEFAHPIGLAAGFDKNGRVVEAMSAIGFSHVEVGSVSATASAGNARPRLFRLPEDEAIVVNYGVPNDGAHAIASRLAMARIDAPLGVNVVETNTGQPTKVDGVVEEYVEAIRPFCGIADYFTLNLNCPNTTGGMSPFDDMERLAALLQALIDLDTLQVPIFLKITAHRDEERAEALMACADPYPQVAGFIFNLPPGKGYPLSTPAAIVDPLPGTLCGAPTRQMMDATLGFWAARIDPQRFALVGSGGIRSGADAYRKIRLGASVLQLMSALIYAGPGLVGRICEELVERLDRDGFSQLSDAVGVDVTRIRCP
jgi:dihydroorotate dehydrogenase